MRFVFLSAAGLLVGCAPADVDVPLDLDADGLLVGDPDPENPDADDDGHLDGAEVDAGTDPLDAASHPYFGGWPIDAVCKDDVESTGNAKGQIAEDFELTDQFGEQVRLHDFCGKAVLITSGAFWCGPCMQESAGLEALYQTYKDRGFIILSTWAENVDSAEPTQDEMTAFAEDQGHTFPDVADPGWAINNRFEQDSGIPTQVLLAPGMEVVHEDLDGLVTEEEIEAILPQ